MLIYSSGNYRPDALNLSVPPAAFLAGLELGVKIVLYKAKVVIRADDMCSVTVKLHANGILHHADGEIPQVEIRNTAQVRQPGHDAADFCSCNRLPFGAGAGENVLPLRRELSGLRLSGNELASRFDQRQFLRIGYFREMPFSIGLIG